MNYKVSVSSKSYNVKNKSTPKFKIQTRFGGVQVPAKFGDLEDYNASGLGDKYVIMYDAATQKYIPVNPDDVLSNAVTGGLPNNFINKLDTDLDNKINLDGGSF